MEAPNSRCVSPWRIQIRQRLQPAGELLHAQSDGRLFRYRATASFIHIHQQTARRNLHLSRSRLRHFIVGPRSIHSSQSGSQPNGAQPEHPGADHPVTALQTDGYPFGVADSPSTLHRYQTYSTAHTNTAAGRKLRPYLRRAQNTYRVLRARLPFHHRPI